MFPQFGATADSLNKASTLVFRIGTDAHLYDDPEDVNIAPLLDSKFDSEKCEALKRLLALIAQGFDVSNFFPQVVKNVASRSFEVKKLVYLYLLHYAEKRPNEALLSINYFQKDLGDPNPLVRAWAMRALAGIRLHVISPLVIVAVGKCARDPSVYVRKCAANALPKLHELRQEENSSEIEEIVGILLTDNSPGVVGAAAAAFANVCPTNLSLIGKNYRRLCEILPDVEEWGQITLIGVLLRYVVARHGLVKESIMFSSCGAVGLQNGIDNLDDNSAPERNGICDSELANMVSKHYVEGPDQYLSCPGFRDKSYSGLDRTCYTSGRTNEDIKILLQCTSPLLWSQNSAVVLAAATVHWIMDAVENVKGIVRPLLFLLRSSIASKYVVLYNIQVFSKTMPSLFAPHFEDFFICSSDSYQIKALKLEILSFIATNTSISSIFQEFQEYIRDPDRRFAADTIAAIGFCAQRLTEVASTCLEGLLTLIRRESLTEGFSHVDGEAGVMIQAIISIKAIIKLDPSSHEKVIVQLARSLDSIKVPAVRAMIVWIVGEYNSIGQIIPRMLTTVLQYLAHCFTSEALETKIQILNTTVKVLLCAKGDNLVRSKQFLSYVLGLARYDVNYDVRDRARTIEKLLLGHLDSQNLEEGSGFSQDRDLLHMLSKCVFEVQIKLQSPEPIDYRFYLPGSLSQIVLHAAPGYEALPKPCCLLLEDLAHREIESQEETTNSNSYGPDYPEALSESDEECISESSSRHSTANSTGSDGSKEIVSTSESVDGDGPLIRLSDNVVSKRDNGSDSLGDLMPKRALESWLDEQPGFSIVNLSEQGQLQRSSARISVGDIAGIAKPKTYSLLNPSSANGLKVDYSFSSEISSISPQLVCVEVFFENCSTEPVSKLVLVDEESDKGVGSASQVDSSTSHIDVPAVVPMEEIALMEPGHTIKRTLQVHFHHHLLPLKLVLWCSGKKFPVKLRPDIGYFVRPLPIDILAFADKESQLPGMFECIRRCTFTDHIEELNSDMGTGTQSKDMFLVICKSLALKMLSNANVSLVSVDLPVAANLDDASGLRLRFSCEILHSLIHCLITLAIEGKCSEPLNVSVKVNCEETVFGLNLLNRIVNILVDPSLMHGR